MAQAAVRERFPVIQLRTDTDEALGRLREQAEANEGNAELASRFAQMEARVADIQKIRNKQERDIQLEVLTANMESLRKEAEAEEKDLGQAVMGLNALIESLGAEFVALQAYNEQEQKLIDNRKAHLEAAKSAIFFRGSKTEAAEAALKAAIADADKSMRERLMHSDMRGNLQVFQTRADETIRIMERRRTQIAQQIANVKTRKEAAFKDQGEASQHVTTLDGEIDEKQHQLTLAEDHVAQQENGTPEYVTANESASALRADVERLNADRNGWLAVYQSKEKFVAELEIHENTQVKLHGNVTIWIRALRSDTTERVVTFESRLESMKSMSDQTIASNLDKIGAKIDQNNAEFMAKAGRSSDNLRQVRMEDHPRRMQALATVIHAQAAATAETIARDRTIREDFMKRYGIDPFASSFLRADEQEPAAHAGS